ncbi:hypothetical protein F5X99DRAFT_232570 [Biscogniauxia marginata]|nr:hypothetical protein F5X99DRAFT_232570 [Biscogniauxia marginata]
MSCYMPYCHNVCPNGIRTALDHDKNTIPGKTFYYCSIHRVYHCIKQKTYRYRRRLQQPLCGECAWLFFRFPEEAERRPRSDIPATVDSPAAVVRRPFAGTEDVRDHKDCTSGGYSQASLEPPRPNSISFPVFEAAINDLNQYVSHSRRSSLLGASRSRESSHHGNGSVSDPTPYESNGSHECASVVVRRDPEGDVVMGGSRSGSSSDAGPVFLSDDDPSTVSIPIRDRKSVLEFIPYDELSVLFSVLPLDFHAKFPEVFMFRYTDFRGEPAVQPTSNKTGIQRYFAALDTTATTGQGKIENRNNKSRVGSESRCDSLLRHARWWCCWAQGFEYLEPELRWVLTLVFDFANVMIARQALGGYGAENPVFWRARYYLHDLLGVVEDLAELYEIPNIVVPSLEWFSSS